MALSELQQAQVTKLLTPLCHSPSLARVADQLRHGYRVKGNEVELFASRPSFQPPHAWRDDPIAKFKYIASRRVWQLYCQMSDLKWRRYEPRFESPELAALVQEVERDPTGIFWG
jgi:DUF3024 family protein